METRRIDYRTYKASGLNAVENSYNAETKTIEVAADEKTVKVLQALSGKYVEITEEDRKALNGYLNGVHGWNAEEIEIATKVFA